MFFFLLRCAATGNASAASGAGTLPCPGTEGDARGFVLSVTSPRLENGVTDTRPGLLMFPQNSSTGYLQGTYPAFTVQGGDHFKTTLSCEYGAADCFVIYRLDYRVGGGSIQTLGTFGERYDGLYYAADIDLSGLAGQGVSFILTVLSNGSAVGDRALWVAPRIVRSSSIGGSGAPVLADTPAPTDGTGATSVAPEPTAASNLVQVGEEVYEIRYVDENVASAVPPEAAPAGDREPAEGPAAGPSLVPAEIPAAPPVRTVTLADLYWSQGEHSTARRIVGEILRDDPANPRAQAWLAARTGDDFAEAELLGFLEAMAKEYGYDLS